MRKKLGGGGGGGALLGRPISVCRGGGPGSMDGGGGHDGIDHEETVELMSRDDGSHYSLSRGILPSLGGKTDNKRVKLRRFIVSPFDYRYRSVASTLKIVSWRLLRVSLGSF